MASWGQLCTQRADLATKLGLSLCPAALCTAKALLTRPWGSGWWHIPAPVGAPEGALGCWSPTSAGHRPQALGPSALLELHFPGSWPKPPASQSCREDQLRPHVIGTGLPQSGVQIGGLRELLLPPDTARGPGRGPGAQRREQSLEGAEHGPPVVLGLPVGRLPGPREGRRVHTAGGPVPGAQAVGGSQGGQRKCKQLPPSHPGPWSLRRKTLLPKIAHPKLWPASSRLPTISLGMNEGGRRLRRAGPAPPPQPAEADPGVGARRKWLCVVRVAFLTAPFPPGWSRHRKSGWSLRTGARHPSLHARCAEGSGRGSVPEPAPRVSHQCHLGSLALSSVCKHPV